MQQLKSFECITHALEGLGSIWLAVWALRNAVLTYIHTDPNYPVVGDSIEHNSHPGIHAEECNNQVVIAQLLAVILSKQYSRNVNNVLRLSIDNVHAANVLFFYTSSSSPIRRTIHGVSPSPLSSVIVAAHTVTCAMTLSFRETSQLNLLV